MLASVLGSPSVASRTLVLPVQSRLPSYPPACEPWQLPLSSSCLSSGWTLSPSPQLTLALTWTTSAECPSVSSGGLGFCGPAEEAGPSRTHPSSSVCWIQASFLAQHDWSQKEKYFQCFQDKIISSYRARVLIKLIMLK